MTHWTSCLVASALSLGLLACAPELSSGLPEDDCTSCDVLPGETLTVVRGADVEWARCWVDANINGSTDPVFRRDEISCAINANGTDITVNSINASFRYGKGSVSSMNLDAATLLEDKFSLAAGQEDAYPITVDLHVVLDLSSPTYHNFRTQFVIEKDSMDYDNPKLVRQPFDLWPVEVRGADNLKKFWLTAGYDLPLSEDFRSGDPNAGFDGMSDTTDVSYSVRANGGEVLSLMIPVPSGDENFIHTSTFNTVVDQVNQGTVEIDHPTSFLATDGKLEIVQVF